MISSAIDDAKDIHSGTRTAQNGVASTRQVAISTAPDAATVSPASPSRGRQAADSLPRCSWSDSWDELPDARATAAAPDQDTWHSRTLQKPRICHDTGLSRRSRRLESIRLDPS